MGHPRVGAPWPALAGSLSSLLPLLGLLPLTARQPGLRVLAEGRLLLPSDWVLCSQPPASDQGPPQEAEVNRVQQTIEFTALPFG